MADIALLRNMFDYDHWANRTALESLGTITGNSEKAHKLFGHIIGAGRVWLSRFETPDQPSTQPWPALTLDESHAAIEDLHQRWTVVLDRLGPERLQDDLVYRNLKGEEFRMPIQEALMHLVMHSAYHRGQVAAAVRDAGGKPAVTDYAVYVRQK